MTPRLQCPATAPSPPLCIDLFAGLGGWTEGFLAEGYDVIGFDVERHVYGEHRYPAQLVIQDVCTLHGSQFKDATIIVASSPCQEFSYRAMPWKRAKALGPPELGMHLFAQARRIQLEACEAAGRYIPMIQENVRGARPWVGPAKARYGSFYLWGDVPVPYALPGDPLPNLGPKDLRKIGDQNAYRASAGALRSPRFTNRDETPTTDDGRKVGGDWFGTYAEMKAAGTISPTRMTGKGTQARKAASARIAKIPFPLAQFIARTYAPQLAEIVA